MTVPDEENEREIYINIDTLQLNGISKGVGTDNVEDVPEVSIEYDETYETNNIPLYVNSLYFYDCNVKILEE